MKVRDLINVLKVEDLDKELVLYTGIDINHIDKLGDKITLEHISLNEFLNSEKKYLMSVDSRTIQRKGHWEFNPLDGFYRCCKCGAMTPRSYSQCPSCGAEMK